MPVSEPNIEFVATEEAHKCKYDNYILFCNEEANIIAWENIIS